MIAGHFGLAAAVKAREPQIPVWSLMLATQFMDVVFVPLLVAGIETIEPVSGSGGGYGETIIHADYTHSLIGAAVIAAVPGWLVTRWWGRRGGIVIAAVVFSHWLLDLIVHRDDMPILPGQCRRHPCRVRLVEGRVGLNRARSGPPSRRRLPLLESGGRDRARRARYSRRAREPRHRADHAVGTRRPHA